jgi:hypothetical protein
LLLGSTGCGSDSIGHWAAHCRVSVMVARWRLRGRVAAAKQPGEMSRKKTESRFVIVDSFGPHQAIRRGCQRSQRRCMSVALTMRRVRVAYQDCRRRDVVITIQRWHHARSMPQAASAGEAERLDGAWCQPYPRKRRPACAPTDVAEGASNCELRSTAISIYFQTRSYGRCERERNVARANIRRRIGERLRERNEQR